MEYYSCTDCWGTFKSSKQPHTTSYVQTYEWKTDIFKFNPSLFTCPFIVFGYHVIITQRRCIDPQWGVLKVSLRVTLPVCQSQFELDGQKLVGVSAVNLGSSWRWTNKNLCVHVFHCLICLCLLIALPALQNHPRVVNRRVLFYVLLVKLLYVIQGPSFLAKMYRTFVYIRIYVEHFKTVKCIHLVTVWFMLQMFYFNNQIEFFSSLLSLSFL